MSNESFKNPAEQELTLELLGGMAEEIDEVFGTERILSGISKSMGDAGYSGVSFANEERLTSLVVNEDFSTLKIHKFGSIKVPTEKLILAMESHSEEKEE